MMMPLAFLLFCFTICLHRPAIATGNNEYNSSGEILFKMANFKVFSEGKGPTYVHSDKVIVNGMPWKIWIRHDKNYLGFNLCNDSESSDYAWSCEASKQLSIVSPTTSFKKGNLSAYYSHNSSGRCWGYDKFIEFEILMDPKNDYYNEKDDTVTFKAEFITKKPYGMPAIHAEDPLLVNDKLIYVNKYILAAQSEFFQKLFFGEEEAPKFVGNEEKPKIQIEGIEKAVENFEQLISIVNSPNAVLKGIEKAMEHFEQLISIVNSPNAVLKDDCMANVLQLANHFEMKFVEIDRWQRGQIVFKMTNFKAFSENDKAEDVYSDSIVSIYGLPWQILIKKNGEFLEFYLYTNGDEKDPSWGCEVALKLYVVSTTFGNSFVQNYLHYLDANVSNWGFGEFASFANLMDPRNGVYDEKGDTMTFKGEFVVKKREPHQNYTFNANDELRVKGQVIKVNKYLLAAHSKLFQSSFFEFKSLGEIPQVDTKGIENAEENFRNLISFVNSPNAELEDGFVGTVLQLADFFQLDSIINRCVRFLMNKSKIAHNYKLMLAQQYHIIGMEKQILKDMKKEDFDLVGEHVNTILFLVNHVKNEGDEAYQKLKETLVEHLGVE